MLYHYAESVLKDEDPQYLQVIEYTKKIEDQILGFRAAAKLYIKQLQNRRGPGKPTLSSKAPGLCAWFSSDFLSSDFLASSFAFTNSRLVHRYEPGQLHAAARARRCGGCDGGVRSHVGAAHSAPQQVHVHGWGLYKLLPCTRYSPAWVVM